jgi:antitoxin PrlF
MAFATITSKDQTTIPKEVRVAANLKSGDRIHFTVLEDGTIIVRVKNGSVIRAERECPLPSQSTSGRLLSF